MKKIFKSRKITYTLSIIVVCLVGILIITRGITYAKYVSSSVLNYYLNSKGFYFESSELSQNGKENTDSSWDGESVDFTISNSSNKALSTEFDISYEITCTVDEVDTTKVCYLNGTSSSKVTQTLSTSFICKNHKNDSVDVSTYDEVTCKDNGYVWTSQPTISSNYFEVVDINGNEVDTAHVVITATSTAPYKKTLRGNFVLTKDPTLLGALSLKYETKTHYENLVVTNSYNEDKCLKLTWNPEELLIDTKNNIIKTYTNENNYINGIVFKLDKKNSLNYTFYKQDKSKIYSESNFTLVESNECQ